ncbi:hypothetical protein K466DRAFT_666080 [Polyporus arcularius HHB13444]|uniref:Uncharacterized protein n=1 Tax=Polyporus arcularius HHB13444 TaxID=1314778 RepID=A0A5C3P3A0_9APHY|nr:hypothetical protein K466DRAFT_666080 [Polyporus arcularius HHB13444]
MLGVVVVPEGKQGAKGADLEATPRPIECWRRIEKQNDKGTVDLAPVCTIAHTRHALQSYGMSSLQGFHQVVAMPQDQVKFTMSPLQGAVVVPQDQLKCTMSPFQYVDQAVAVPQDQLKSTVSPLQGFDQVVAVSQDQINASLDARFSLDPSSLKFSATIDDGETMTGIMTPPTVNLLVQYEPFQCFFSLHFVSGSFTYYTIKVVGGKPVAIPHTVPIDGWTLAFTVNLGLNVLDNVPPEIKAKILVPGSYSVSQLLMDFTTADLMSFDPELSKTPGIEVPLGKDPERDDKIGSFIRIYLEQLELSTDHNILGYAVTVPDPSVANPIAPSFPPTSVQFQTMAYQGDLPKKVLPGGLDCFLFLEMTQNRTAPHTVIDWEWNWVQPPSSPPGPREGGCMVLAKSVFWDAFFVGRATFLNRMALDMLNRVGWAIDNQYSTIGDDDLPWSLTDSDPPDSALAWTSAATSTTQTWDWNCTTSSDDPFRPYTHKSDTQVTVELDTENNAINFSANTHVWRENHIIIEAGSQAEDDVCTIDATVQWGFVFTLTSVAKGALGVSVAASYSPPKTSVTMKKDSNYGHFEVQSDSELSANAKAHLDCVMGKLDLVDDVANAFKNHSQFVFPGGGTFFMKDPAFNDAGDVVVGLTYQQE